jgi:hypothetical protein
MTWSVLFEPLIPYWAIALLAVLALVVVAVGVVLRARGALLRAIATAALLLGLANPVLQQEEREHLSNIAVVVVDESLSQSLGGRIDQARSAEDQLRSQLEDIDGLEVRWVTSGSSVTASTGETRLFSDLFAALGDVPPDRFAGGILVTDGQVHDIPDSLVENGYDGPVHGLMTGYRNQRDRRIVIERAPRYGIVGESRTVEFRVDDEVGSEPAEVEIIVDGEVVRTMHPPIGETVAFPLEITHGGQTVTEIVVGLTEGELTPHNNRAVFTTDGVRERLRVLLVSGEPHPGERTWRNLLKADAAVDLVHFTILRPPEKQDGTPIRELSLIAFPTRELFSVKLNEFDLIIFDRYQRRGVLPILYLSNIARYVEQGGAILVAAGPAFATPLSLHRTPLADVLPSTPTGDVTILPYRPTLTEDGIRHPVTRSLQGGLSDPPDWGRWFRMVDVEQTAGDALMSGPRDMPLVILDRRGEGRVAQLLSDHAWLWARGFDGGGPQAELLRRLAHWLMQEPDLEEEALRAQFDGQHLIIERQTMEDSAEPVTIVSPSGDEQSVSLAQTSPGLWQAQWDAEEVGLHRLTDGTLSAVAAVGNANNRELRDIRATTELLEPISQATGSGLYWLSGERADVETATVPRVRMVTSGRRMAGNNWLGLRDNEAYIVRALRSLPLYSTLLGLSVLLMLLGFTWFREGR